MGDYEKELNIDMIQWIVATKDSKTKEYYKKYYNDYFELTEELAGQIVAEFLLYSDYPEILPYAFKLLYMDLTLIKMQKGTDKFTYHEMLWYAWKNWCFHLTRTKLTEMFGNEWEPIFDRLRKEWQD